MLYLAYGIVGGGLVIALIVQGVYGMRLRSETDEIRSRLAALSSRGEGGEAPVALTPEILRTQHEKIAFANDILRRDSFRWTKLLDDLEASAVDGVTIRALQPDFKERNLRVRGAARGVDDMRRYLDQLIASARFSEVYLLEQAREESSKGDKEKGAPEGPRGITFSILLKGAF